jgi:hypothetical protein
MNINLPKIGEIVLYHGWPFIPMSFTELVERIQAREPLEPGT